MRTIWKFPIHPADQFFVVMPAGAKILHVAHQDRRDFANMWVEVDTEASPETRRFVVVGTGHPIPDEPDMHHVGTWLMGHRDAGGGEYVWHLYELRAS